MISRPSPDMKLSKSQYQEILKRTMDRQGKNVSQDLGQIQQSMVPQGPDPLSSILGGAAMAGEGLPAQPSFAPPIDPMAGPSLMSQPIGQPPTGVTGHMADAKENWKQLQAGLAGKIWNRVYATAKKIGSGSPEQFFIQEFTKYRMDPQTVTNDTVRNFFDTLEESGQLSSGQQDPFTKAVMNPNLGGMM